MADTSQKYIKNWIDKALEHTHHAARCNGKMRDSYRVVGNALGAGSYGQVFKCCFIESMAKRD